MCLNVELPAMEIRKAIKLIDVENINIYFDVKNEIVIFSADNFFFRYGTIFSKTEDCNSFFITILSKDLLDILKQVRSKAVLFTINVLSMSNDRKEAQVELYCSYKESDCLKKIDCKFGAYAPKEIQNQSDQLLSTQFSQFIYLCKDCRANEYIPVTTNGELCKKNDVLTFSILGLNESYYYLKRCNSCCDNLDNGIYEFDLNAIKRLYAFISNYVMKEPFSISFQNSRIIISYQQMSYQIPLNKVKRSKGVCSLFKRSLVSSFNSSVNDAHVIEKCSGISFIDRRSKYLPANVYETERYYYCREDDKKSKSLLQVIWMKSREV